MNTSLSQRLASIVARFCCCALLLTSALFIPCAQAQSGRAQRERVVTGSGPSSYPAEPAAQRGHSTITGRVIHEENGEPVRGAHVRLSTGRGERAAEMVITNGRGEFRFTNLIAGEYHVIVTPDDAPMVGSATFAVPLPTGDPRADDAAFAAARTSNETANGNTVLNITVDGQQDAQVEIRLPRQPRGGQVSGRVTYEDGKPAANAQLTFLNRKELMGRMIGPTRLTVSTDEHGGYRIGGLPPGDYIVSARLQEQRYVDKEGRTYGGLVILTYYPSATSARSATPLHLDADQELTDINITLVKRDTHTVSGTIISRRGARQLAGLRVRLRNREDLELPFSVGADDRFTQTNAQGRFSFEQVMDGDYVISVGGSNSLQMPRVSMTGPGASREALPPRLRDATGLPEPLSRVTAQPLIEKRQDLTVAGADVNDLTIELSEGGRVSGTISIEGEGQIPERLIVTAAIRPGERRPSAFVRPDPNGTFSISGLPEGPLSLDVVITPPARLYVKSITANGVDLRREPVQIGDGTEIRDVRIVLSSDVATLTGRVLSSDGTPLQGATVFLVPAGAGVGPIVRGRLVAVTGSGGRFIIIAGPGEYRAVVWKSRPPADEEAFRALAASATQLSLQVGERKDVDLVAPDAQ